MAKSSNPVDAHRKAQRKAELKKNKQARTKQKEVQTVKKDTRPIEADIRRLSQKGNLSLSEKDELASLRAELAAVNKAKTEYVEAHPEHRKFVFPDRPQTDVQGDDGNEPPGLYDRNGRLKHPERSLYYDPVFNPFGVPPPGMPYREKPEFEAQRLGLPTRAQIAAFHQQLEAAQADEDSDSDDEEDDEDDDIVMPPGPPPTGQAAEEDSGSDSSSDDDDDDIALPPGPPPPKPNSQPPPSSTLSSRPLISRPSHQHHQHPHPHSHPYAPLPPRPSFQPPPPLPPPSNAPRGPRNPSSLPARPPPPTAHRLDPLNADKNASPHRAFQQGAPPSNPRDAPPPGAVISAAPSPPGPSPFLPIPGASSAATTSGGGGAGGATISAAPQLRDLKKEATAFVPSAMRRKMAQQKQQLAKVGLAAVNAAPSSSGGGGAGEGGEEGGQGGERKKSLMEQMRERGIGGAGAGGALPPSVAGVQKKTEGGDEDYKRFEDEMKEFL
ncbi:hypothetical protein JCM8547_007363 [Rhodosporidiobolus lusitaniae]